MKSIKLILLTSILIFFIIQNAQCTRCPNGYLTWEKRIERAELIFIGKLKSKSRKKNFENKFEFVVERVLKNDRKVKSNFMTVFSYDSKLMMCGTSVPFEDRQLVIANWNENNQRYSIMGGDNISMDNELHQKHLNKVKEILNFNRFSWWKWGLSLVALALIFVIIKMK